MIIPIRPTGLIGSYLTHIRGAAGLSQTALAARSGVANSQISKYERALVTPDIETVRKLLEACGWQLVATPAAEVDTQVARDALISAARGWSRGETSGDILIWAIGCLDRAEAKAAARPSSATPDDQLQDGA